MNTKEGLLRIVQVLKWIGYLFLGGFFIAAVNDASSPLFFIIFGGCGFAFFYCIAWVLEGFAKDK